MTDLDSGADLHVLMDRALTDLPTPAERLREGAVRRGRSLRRRRRAGVAAASVAVVAAFAAVAVPFVGGSGPAPGGVAVDPPAAKVPPSPSHPGWWDMPVGEMRDRLLALLPDDVEITGYARVNTDHAPGESDKFAGVFNGTLRDQTDLGPGSVSIMLTELPRDPAALAEVRAQHFRCNDDDFEFVDLESPASCETSDVRDGHAHERTVTFTDQGVTYIEVRRWAGDGEIYAAVANSTERKWGPLASALRPPLTLPELIKIAESSSWFTD
jgi:hypothetical protein